MFAVDKYMAINLREYIVPTKNYIGFACVQFLFFSFGKVMGDMFFGFCSLILCFFHNCILYFVDTKNIFTRESERSDSVCGREGYVSQE